MNTLLDTPAAPLWKRIGIKPHQGICIFLPALRSRHSCGIGEFFDLLPLIDWCHDLQMDVVQLLPLNNSDSDPSPYNPMSACALNFLLLSLHALPYLDDLPALKKKLQGITELNQTARIAYQQVIVHKMSWLQAYYDAVGEKIQKSPAFRAFLAENDWVEPFALFRSLKDHLNNSPLSTWPKELRFPSEKKVSELQSTNTSKIAFYAALQFLCHSQLKEVKKYANSKGVFLKGDIPLLVGCESAEAWLHPHYFHTEFIAGSPPDPFNQEGQYWGFPLFRWEALRQDHFAWWRRRLQYASHFFDLFRVDHIIGFFRIWAIPPHTSPKQGHFIPEKPEEWEAQGRELLHMLIDNAQGMLPIGEDLGTIPDILPLVLTEMGIPGTKVIRWTRNWKTDKSYIPLDRYPLASLTTVSTHDSETLAQWWQNVPEEARAFAAFKKWEDYTPALSLRQRQEILWDAHHSSSLFHINPLQEYLALFSELVSSRLEEERINVPGTVSDTNWTYRYLPSVEELTTHVGLRRAMKKILFPPTSDF